MNWYEKHLGDWAKKTGHLSMLEEGAYNRLCDWCYAHERPLPLAMSDVYRVARAVSPTERRAVARVIEEFFMLSMDGWHQGRIDKVLSAFCKAVERNTNNPASAAQRAQRYRDKRSALFKRANALGLNPGFNTPNADIEAMLAPQAVNGPTSRESNGVTSRDDTLNATACRFPPTSSRDVTDGAATSLSVPAGPTADGFASAARDAAAANGVVDPTLTGKAAKAMKAAGFHPGNVADPRFLALVNAGVTEDEWRLTAAEAVARGKQWGWLLATIAGRRSDVANGYAPLAAPGGPNRRDPNRVAGLTPTIAAKPPKPPEPDEPEPALAIPF